jgi:hypothetical protein
MKMKLLFLKGINDQIFIRGLFICAISFLPFFSTAQNFTNGKIPIDTTRWYQTNNSQTTMGPFFDGILQQRVYFGYGLVLSNWDLIYPVLPGEIIQLEQIKMYDWEGVFKEQPATIYIIDDKWQKIPIGSFYGPRYDIWTGPYPDTPDQYTLNKPITNIKYIVINTYGNMPSEIEFYGNYQPPTISTSSINTNALLKNMSGVNGFEWDFLNGDGFTVNQHSVKTATAFKGFRHYLDWEKLESAEGSYTFNPSYSGSWNLDTLYSICKQNNMEVLACIKNMPNWMQDTYPVSRQNSENVPVKFGKDFNLPNSYLEYGKLAFQFAARYGSNKNVNTALLSVNTTPRWTNDLINTIKTGLNLVKYIECNNETDKWWKGSDAYQSGRQYAANLSAFYDGHLGSMGAGIGAKNADPNIKIVMAGTATATTDYLRGMIDWCAEKRGYLPDGSINYCWDVINYHFYSNDAKSSQSGYASFGVAPELADYENTAKRFVKASSLFGKNMPVWVTETGYDINSNQSAQYAPTIGVKSILETQADWILRTALLSARSGIAKVFYYEMYDDNPYGGQFGSSGLVNTTDSSRRPAAKFLYQMNQNFGDYVYQETINHNPEVDRYLYNKQSMFVVWNPTQTGATTSYNLDYGKMDSATIYAPNALADTMKISLIRNTKSTLSLTVTETPIFVIPHLHQIDLLDFAIKTVDGHKVGMSWTVSSDSTVQQFSVERMNESTKVFTSIGTINPNTIRSALPTYTFVDSAANNGFNHYRLKTTVGTLSYFYSNPDNAFVGSLVSYPNPFTGFITLQGLASGKVTTLKVFGSDGSMVKVTTTNANSYQWNLSSLPNGTYTIVADDGINRQQVRINKMPLH